MPPNYQSLPAYQQAELIVVWTDQFCQHFLIGAEYFRLRDQMTSSARSVKQNIAEGATRNSVKDYIQFVGFSRASGEELLEDYKDLAQKWQIAIWSKNDSKLQWWRKYRDSKLSWPSLPSSKPEAVNYLIDLVTRTNYLLDQQRRGLERAFIEKGGYTENLAKQRLNYRDAG